MPAYIPWPGSPSSSTSTPSSPESKLQTPSLSSIRDVVQDSPPPTATSSYIPWPGALPSSPPSGQKVTSSASTNTHGRPTQQAVRSSRQRHLAESNHAPACSSTTPAAVKVNSLAKDLRNVHPSRQSRFVSESAQDTWNDSAPKDLTAAKTRSTSTAVKDQSSDPLRHIHPSRRGLFTPNLDQITSGKNTYATSPHTDVVPDLDLTDESPSPRQAPAGTGGRPKRPTPGQAAKFVIDDFLSDADEFRSEPSNKLKLWQSFCIELGLVQVDTNPLPSFRDLKISSNTPSFSTPEMNLPALPTSSRGCLDILQAKGHVNIVDYFRAHRQNRESMEFKSYHYLLWPSEEAVAEYSRDTKKTASRDQYEDDWLKPLLREILNHRSGGYGRR